MTDDSNRARKRELDRLRNDRRNDRYEAFKGEKYEVRPIAYLPEKLAATCPAIRHAMEARDQDWVISLIEGLLRDFAEGEEVESWREDCAREGAWKMSRLSRRDKAED